MLSLTEEQIAFIENDIKVRGITSPDLSIDLLDHICCLIENELDEYRNFDTVYQKTLLLFGDKGLKEIQDETNRLLTFKHYYFMNSTMKISGYVSSLMILLGSIFKIQHWPGANVLILIGVFFLAVLFLPLLFILKFKSTEENNRSIVLSIIAFVSAALICIGILFRILHWPGARMMTMIGCTLLLLGYLPIYVLSIYKNTTNKINATATIILIIAGVGLFITESGIGLSKTTSDTFWRGVTESNDLLLFNHENNNNSYQQLFSKRAADTLFVAKLKLVKNATDSVMLYTKKMKVNLISRTLGISELDAERIELDSLRQEGYGDQLTQFLLSSEYANHNFTAQKLKLHIEAYKQLLVKVCPSVNFTTLNTNKIIVYGEQVNWEIANFDRLPLPLVIYNITKIELSIKASETAAIQSLL
jgi:hypothetical protein